MTTWPDYPFIRDDDRAQEPRTALGERTGWEVVIFELSAEDLTPDDRPLHDALTSLGDAIRSAERLVADFCLMGEPAQPPGRND